MLKMEVVKAPRVLRHQQLSEEHEKMENTLGGKRKGKEKRDQSGSAKEPGGPKSQEVIDIDENNPATEFEDEAATIEVAAPRKATRARHASTPSRQLFMVEKQKKVAPPTTGEMQAVLAAFQEVKEQLQSLYQENQALREEVTSLKAAFENFKAAPPLTWAQVASVGNGPTSADASWPSLPASQRPNTTPTWSSRPSQMDLATYHNREKTVVVNIGALRSTHQAKSPEEIKVVIQEELAKDPKTKEVEVIGITGPHQGRLELHTASRKQAEAARNNIRWARELSERAKPREATWYPVKVDSVSREMLCRKEGTGWEFKDDAKDYINSQNSRPDFKVQVMKLHWLSKVSDKPLGSLVMYLDSWPVAQQMVAEGIVRLGPTIGFPSPFYKREQPVRCYNCNQYGHMQGKCTMSARCGICAAHHQTKNCKGVDPVRCAACHGAHKVTDPQCTIFIKEQEKLRLQKTGRREATLVPSCQ
jgi:hypothetical protein